jgi:chlorinating enzyme
LQLTEKDLKFFYDNGYLGPFDLIDPDEAKALQEHLVNLYNQESKIYSYSRGDYEFDDPTAPDLAKVIRLELAKRQGHDRHLEDPTLLNLFKRPEITERCAQLLGSDIILWYSQFFQKPPHSNKTELHQESTWLSFDQKRSILHPEDSEELF